MLVCETLHLAIGNCVGIAKAGCRQQLVTHLQHYPQKKTNNEQQYRLALNAFLWCGIRRNQRVIYFLQRGVKLFIILLLGRQSRGGGGGVRIGSSVASPSAR